MTITNYLLSSIVFWLSWIIIPLIMEVMPAIVNFFILVKKFILKKEIVEQEYWPEITLIIPVYNSADSLYNCIKSVYDSTYDNKLINLLLVNNKSKDNSFEVFSECQKEFPELNMNWLNSEQGKSKALNLALFNSTGKYIIHIDSDGVLHKAAIKNMVSKFEQDSDVHCVTGTILTNPEMIDNTKSFFKRLFLKVEFLEYCQAFLAGRNYQAEFNNIFTLSGAFSAFRKSAILKTQLYNTDTVCEDTHVTFQIRDNLKKKVCICDTAYFFVDPIEDINRLYTQRQRWQRGEIEVAHMFLKDKLKASGFFTNFVIRVLMFDHTFAFPRMIWYFALICLLFMNYPFKLIGVSLSLIFALYTLSAFLFYINISIFLAPYKDIQKYYMKKWYAVFLLPYFNFLVFWFRFAGIINSIKTPQTWKTQNFTEEFQKVRDIIKKDFFWLFYAKNKINNVINKESEES